MSVLVRHDGTTSLDLINEFKSFRQQVKSETVALVLVSVWWVCASLDRIARAIEANGLRHELESIALQANPECVAALKKAHQEGEEFIKALTEDGK